MELVGQQKVDEDSVQRISTSDSGQPLAPHHSLLSIKTLESWHVPEHCMVTAFYRLNQATNRIVYFVLQHKCWIITRAKCKKD